MNNYELFNFESINKNDINILKPMNEYKKNINYLYNGIGDVKPIEEVPDKLYRDEFMEQDIEIDINSNKFREVWNEYKNLYEDKNKKEEIKTINLKENVKEESYEEKLDSFYSKAKELNEYLMELSNERKEIKEKKELLELTQKELEQEKELLNIEKEKFEEYKNNEKEKLNKDKIRFQNMVEEIKNKIETILN